MSLASSDNTSEPRDYRLAWILLIYFLVTSGISAALPASGGWPRYFLYAMPAVTFASVLALLDNKRIVLDTRILVFLLLYGLSVVIATLHSGYYNHLTTRDVILTTIPFVTLLVRFRVPPDLLKWLVIGLMCLHFTNIIDELMAGTLGGSIDLQHSQGLAESTFAFPLTALFIYVLLTKRYWYALVVLLAVFLAFKRIALGGMICAVTAYFALQLIDGQLGRGIRPRLPSKIALIGFLVIIAVISRHIVDIFDYIDAYVVHLYVHTPEEVLLGRYKVNQNLFFYLFDDPKTTDHLFGLGIGTTSAYASKWTAVVLLHNDMLKLQVEHGIIGTIMIVSGFILVFSRTYVSMALFVYAVTLWLTDNTLIYVSFSFVLILLNRMACQDLLPEEQEHRQGYFDRSGAR